MIWAMFIVTTLSCAYSIYLQFQRDAFKKGFILLAKMAYNPKTERDVTLLMEKLEDEYIRFEKTNNE